MHSARNLALWATTLVAFVNANPTPTKTRRSSFNNLSKRRMKDSLTGVTCGLWATGTWDDSWDAIDMATTDEATGEYKTTIVAPAQSCSRLGCINNSGIYVCNDQDVDVDVDPFELEDSAQSLISNCQTYWGYDIDAVSGQAFYGDPGINLVAAYCDSNDPPSKKPSDYGTCASDDCPPSCGWPGADVPRCDDFYPSPSAVPRAVPAVSKTRRSTSHSISKRDFSDDSLKCDQWATATKADAVQVIQDVTANGGAIVAAPQSCSRLGGLYICNDQDVAVVVQLAELAIPAGLLVDTCAYYYAEQLGTVTDQTLFSGQLWSSDPDVNMVVSYCDSNDDPFKKPSEYDAGCGDTCPTTCGYPGADYPVCIPAYSLVPRAPAPAVPKVRRSRSNGISKKAISKSDASKRDISKRTLNGAHGVTCGGFATADYRDINDLIHYLTQGAGGGAFIVPERQCSLLGYRGDSGLYACNDGDIALVLQRDDVLRPASALVLGCERFNSVDSIIDSDLHPVSGQVFFDDPALNLVVAFWQTTYPYDMRPSDIIGGLNGATSTCGYSGADEEECPFTVA
ncbi:uncharacterized protein LTR77_008300 [Saxophila tyrrhenica]|uniref:Uncharacterized protein n=1 Tax=Saxophila tyrrhenica TaxID=1690608 RepID=A0AAV9P0K0_9PEZI|nr:hypothetical protein LTR77_008300 [Saxophila tyrrhenica]